MVVDALSPSLGSDIACNQNRGSVSLVFDSSVCFSVVVVIECA